MLQLNSFTQGLLQERWAQRRWARKEGSEILILSRLKSRSSQRGQPTCLGSLSLMLFLGVLHSLVQKLCVFCSLIVPSYCFFRAVGDCVPGRMTRWWTMGTSSLFKGFRTALVDLVFTGLEKAEALLAPPQLLQHRSIWQSGNHFLIFFVMITKLRTLKLASRMHPEQTCALLLQFSLVYSKNAPCSTAGSHWWRSRRPASWRDPICHPHHWSHLLPFHSLFRASAVTSVPMCPIERSQFHSIGGGWALWCDWPPRRSHEKEESHCTRVHLLSLHSRLWGWRQHQSLKQNLAPYIRQIHIS